MYGPIGSLISYLQTWAPYPVHDPKGYLNEKEYATYTSNGPSSLKLVSSLSNPASTPKKCMSSSVERFLQVHSEFDDHNICLAPFNYVKTMPSKGVREEFVTALQQWYHVPADKLRIISNIITMLHTSSLIIDDIEDGSNFRRGLPAAHKKFGLAKAINSSNYIFPVVNLEALKLGLESVKVVSEELCFLHHGQGLDIQYRDDLECPSEDAYIHIVSQKTGGLFRMLVRLMQACATKNQQLDLTNFANLLGQLFQVRDDYKNLMSEEYASQKGFAEDLDEGKFSIMMIHGINADRNNTFLLDTLRTALNGGQSLPVEHKRRVIQYLEEKRSFKYARKVMKELSEAILEEYKKVAKLTRSRNPTVEALMKKLKQ